MCFGMLGKSCIIIGATIASNINIASIRYKLHFPMLLQYREKQMMSRSITKGQVMSSCKTSEQVMSSCKTSEQVMQVMLTVIA